LIFVVVVVVVVVVVKKKHTFFKLFNESDPMNFYFGNRTIKFISIMCEKFDFDVSEYIKSK
jgi:hypothetical protein